MEPTIVAREHHLARGSAYSDLFTRFSEARIRHAQGRLKDACAILAAARVRIENGFGARSDLAANCAAFEAQTLYDQDALPEPQVDDVLFARHLFRRRRTRQRGQRETAQQ